jgi:hypothetical protein
MFINTLALSSPYGVNESLYKYLITKIIYGTYRYPYGVKAKHPARML